MPSCLLLIPDANPCLNHPWSCPPMATLLPNELLFKVIHSVPACDRTTLRSCTLLTWPCCHFTQAIFFRTLRFRSRERITMFLRLVRHNPRIANYVRQLILEDLRHPELPELFALLDNVLTLMLVGDNERSSSDQPSVAPNVLQGLERYILPKLQYLGLDDISFPLQCWTRYSNLRGIAFSGIIMFPGVEPCNLELLEKHKPTGVNQLCYRPIFTTEKGGIKMGTVPGLVKATRAKIEALHCAINFITLCDCDTLFTDCRDTLRYLTLEVQHVHGFAYPNSTEFAAYIRTLDLSRFPHLTSWNIHVNIAQGDGNDKLRFGTRCSHQSSVGRAESITRLLATAPAGSNVLEEIGIIVDVVYASFGSCDPLSDERGERCSQFDKKVWDELDALFVDSARFPRLKAVTFYLVKFLDAPWDDAWKYERSFSELVPRALPRTHGIGRLYVGQWGNERRIQMAKGA
ncbi:hypothetical protein DL96DRAFT_312876 [Flagelloscypha sp. PMI_526]|nr:hypothetical protein DL96DRAFT_312876 [Flagelloscypha sp. PMI_526]